MIVVNKRYYDYDYDNNCIVMFDAEDTAATLDLDDTYYSSDEEEVLQTSNDDESKSSPTSSRKKIAIAASNSHHLSESADTVAEDIAMPLPAGATSASHNSPSSSSNSLAVVDSANSPAPVGTGSGRRLKKSSISSSSSRSSSNSNSSGLSSVSWISCDSPKGKKRIPYAVQVAHSYTINKLPVQLTHLVNTKTLQRQAKERRKAEYIAQAQQWQLVNLGLHPKIPPPAPQVAAECIAYYSTNPYPFTAENPAICATLKYKERVAAARMALMRPVGPPAMAGMMGGPPPPQHMMPPPPMGPLGAMRGPPPPPAPQHMMYSRAGPPPMQPQAPYSALVAPHGHRLK